MFNNDAFAVEHYKEDNSSERLKKLKKRTEGAWYQFVLPELPKCAPVNVDTIENLYSIATNIYNKRVEDKLKTQKQTLEERMLTKGTSSDRVAALTLVIQQNPKFRLKQLDMLLNHCSSHNNREAELAIEATKDLFFHDLLPYRELNSFTQNNLGAIQKALDLKKKTVDDKKLSNEERELVNVDTNKYLFFWYFEDALKTRYKKFLDILKEKTNSIVLVLKQNALRAARDLIIGSKEQREYIIQILVSKFADINRKVASRAMYYMLSTINPSMGKKEGVSPYHVKDIDKKMMVREVANFLLKPKGSQRGKPYAATFLSNIILTKEVDRDLAVFLINTQLKVCKVYFDLKEVDAGLMSSVLAGIFRAFQFSELKVDHFSEHIDMFFKIARIAHFNTAVEAMRVIWTIARSSEDVKLNSRYYTLLYSKLLDRDVMESSKMSIFLHLVMQSILDDTDIHRSMALVKRLVQSCYYMKPAYACGVLIIMKEILKRKPGLKTLLTQAEYKAIEEEEEEHFTDVKTENTIQDAIVEDDDEQDLDMDSNFRFDEKANATEDETSEEEGDFGFKGDLDKDINMSIEDKKTEKEQKAQQKPKFEYPYKMHNPRPQEANADKTCLWEMTTLREYFHPSVSKFAEFILQNKSSFNYEGNPLEDFTLTRFLDKFMNRKPKTKKLAGLAATMQRSTSIMEAIRPKVYTEEFVNLHESMIREDEKFYHKFLREQKRQKDKKELLKQQRKEEKLARRTKQKRIKELVKSRAAELERDEDEMSDISNYSYSELDKVLEHDTVNEEFIDEMFMRYESDDDEAEFEDSKKGKKKKKDKNFAWDVTEGDIQDTALANQDEMSQLLNPDSETEEPLSDDEEMSGVGEKRKKKPKKAKSKKLKKR